MNTKEALEELTCKASEINNLKRDKLLLVHALTECVTDENDSGMQQGLGRQKRRLLAINEIAKAAVAKATSSAV